MKVILLKDIRGIGKKDQLKEVSDGYARNYLLPRELAREATQGALHDLDSKNKSIAFKKSQEREFNQALADKINNREILIHAKSGATQKLFGAITQKEIAHEIHAQLGVEIDKKKILLDEPIKSLGLKVIEIKFLSDINAKINLVIKNLE